MMMLYGLFHVLPNHTKHPIHQSQFLLYQLSIHVVHRFLSLPIHTNMELCFSRNVSNLLLCQTLPPPRSHFAQTLYSRTILERRARFPILLKHHARFNHGLPYHAVTCLSATSEATTCEPTTTGETTPEAAATEESNAEATTADESTVESTASEEIAAKAITPEETTVEESSAEATTAEESTVESKSLEEITAEATIPEETTAEEAKTEAASYVKDEPESDCVITVEVEEPAPAEKKENYTIQSIGVPQDSSLGDGSVQLLKILEDLNIKFDEKEKYSYLALAVGASIILWIAVSVVRAIDSIPLLPKVFELIGLGYTLWFGTRNLVLQESREELVATIVQFKQDVIGSDDDW